jgi:hypothetical protein
MPKIPTFRTPSFFVSLDSPFMNIWGYRSGKGHGMLPEKPARLSICRKGEGITQANHL